MRKKISIIGGGQIGGVLTQLIALKELADVALVDINEGVPQGKVLDIYEASKIDAVDVNMIGSTDYSIIKNSDIVIVTAGVPRKPGMSRDDLLVVNSNIMKVVATNIKEFAPDSIVIVISNPLDAMVTLCQKITGFKHNKVIGQAGVLDSSRFASFIAWELNVSVKDINSIVLGGHGDTMVPLVRYANVNGIPVTDMLNKKYGKEKALEVMAKIVQRTRDAGGEVVALLKTGSAFYSPAAAAIQMVEAILKNERRILPIAAYLNGEYNISGFYMGVPVILGENGAESVIEVELNEDERVMFDNSLNAVKKNVEDLTRLGF